MSGSRNFLPPCSPAGVEYTLVDDNHFLSAGFEPEQLYGYYIAEDLGHTVKLLPGLENACATSSRFATSRETTGISSGSVAVAHPDGFAAMGDDLEKFGVWPGTHAHCYPNGWLENFFTALEKPARLARRFHSRDGHRRRIAPLGRADLPTASYTEMMEWALPTAAREHLPRAAEEFPARADVMPFLRGGCGAAFSPNIPNRI